MRIVGYDSFEQIAVGGMAVVYKARKLSIKKTVAVKVLLPHLAADLQFTGRFQQEAQTAARIQHDNIVNVIDYGVSDGSYYIVMEYYDGVNLEELMQERQRLPVDIALTIALHVAYGLDAAHSENLIHRDVKPANVILAKQGGIKVADFGLAKDTQKTTLMTHTGKVVGTPAYMSPEQTRGGPLERTSDIFSLGVITYEMLTGRRPFEGGSYSEVVDRVQSFDPPPPGALNPLVDADVEAVVSHMLAKRVEERYGSMGEVIADLEAIMKERGLRHDRRVLKDFYEDPEGYTARAEEALRAGAGVGSSGSGGERGAPARGRRFWRGHGQAASAAGTRDDRPGVAENDTPDPTLDYSVTLVSIDRETETPDTFALKLSMRLKSPLPRMRSLVARTPCVLVQRVPYRKACSLCSVVEQLGGKARMQAIREEPVVVEAPMAQETPAPAEKPVSARRAPSGALFCPSCGWEEDAEARFCSMCRHTFDKTERINLADLAGMNAPADNPFAVGHEAQAPRRFRMPDLENVSARALLIAGGALLVLPMLIFTLLR